MKALLNKKYKVPLIAGVLALWIYIIVKFIGLFQYAEASNIQTSPGQTQAVNSVSIDTFQLIVDYHDPFLKGRKVIQQHKPKNVKVQPVRRKSLEKEEIIVWPAINYFGIFSDVEDATSAVVLTISGRNFIMEEGDLENNIELVKIQRDSVLLAFSGSQKYFVRNGIIKD